ncbi:hypothetical protein [Thermoflexus sp.]|uniref:hypothetical protein n=1 Tax=Thermoflexus sp. TaxID=1969742 RepID=UPI0025E9387C|nr:hypothetical protein [Thermoflexus sp.]MDW8179868.1 hypothetical protein [Anaerolineae bacterium]MCS6963552.1 hypothetical protein [Thermoflexus sp.]MCS7350417.1 hypothetical protein [Thermoflexus sp.]MCX7689963.1 hypothetical protein [Thermoflexus sp.]MDW8185778.1 hypothetical protein [Anaerolineae bacterium]
MAPVLSRLAFTMGLTLFLLALMALPFLSPGSPAFVVDVLALLISGGFLALLVWSIRREVARHIPSQHNQEEHHDASSHPSS